MDNIFNNVLSEIVEKEDKIILVCSRKTGEVDVKINSSTENIVNMFVCLVHDILEENAISIQTLHMAVQCGFNIIEN